MLKVSPVRPKMQKVKLKTASEFYSWLTKKEPIFQDTKMQDIKLKKYRHTVNQHKKMTVNMGKEINSTLQAKIANVVKLFNEMENMVITLRRLDLSFGDLLDNGLNKFMQQKKKNSPHAIKNIGKDGESAVVFYSPPDSYFRMTVKDSQYEPTRGYFIANNRIAKNFNPKFSFNFERSIYANEAEVKQIEGPLNDDLDWVSDSLAKSIDFIKNKYMI